MPSGSGQVLDIQANLDEYLADRDNTTGRYALFDYCFNYFQGQRQISGVMSLVDPEQLQTSCLQLGFYLASWGMFRGSAELLNRSVKCFVPVLEAIVQAPPEVWDIDVDTYTADAVETILRVGQTLGKALPGGRSPTLVTKTMLGVFGCAPAFDNYFRRGFGVWTFGKKALRDISEFYDRNAEVIDKNRVATWDFNTGGLTERLYTRAKVIDMLFFIEGAEGRPAVERAGPEEPLDIDEAVDEIGGSDMPRYDTTCRAEVLDAVASLERRHGRDTFSPAEIIAEVLARGSDHPESTIRTHIVSAMCINAPPNHAVRYPDLERVSRAQYRRVGH